MAAAAALPEGWAAYQDPEGRTYYANAATGETSWESPALEAVAAFPTAPIAAAPGCEPEPWEEQVVEAVRLWFMETEMQQLFNDAAAFADANCEVFDVQQDEHKLEYTALHQQYQAFFEAKLNAFLASIGHTSESFQVAFEKMVKKNGGAKTMAELMWCCLDYEFFCQIMVERKKELQSQRGY
mmetsp:Transcript_45688/g.126794  ORF Transcript_45688/g.126794 Transcript_45688/m.126794 type:complete len:183 (-) Transcript_45688:251-799(-)